MKISVSDSYYIKGIAILLMFAHHLFAFDDRVLTPSQYIQMLSFFDFEEKIGQFGKICVPIFLFISGYGLALSKKRNIFKKIFQFFCVYWFYFGIFIPVGFFFYHDVVIFGTEQLRFTPNIKDVAFNSLFINTKFNGEWWFGRVYIEMIVLSYLLGRTRNNATVILIISSIVSVIGFIIPIVFLSQSVGVVSGILSKLSEFMLWQLPFVFGFLFASEGSLLERLIKAIPMFFYPFICWLLFVGLNIPGLILATPFFVLFVIENKIKKITYTLEVLGKYSFPMWLIHSFFCYYYWQEIIYYPKYSILVLVNLTILSFILSFYLEKIRNYLALNVQEIFMKSNLTKN